MRLSVFPGLVCVTAVLLLAGRPASAAAPVDSTLVAQKIGTLDRLLAHSRMVELAKTDNGAALVDVRRLRQEAEKLAASGDTAEAERRLTEALRIAARLSAAAGKAQPLSEADQKRVYQDLSDAMGSSRDALQEAAVAKKTTAQLDNARVDSLIKQARQHADGGRFTEAIATLREARGMVEIATIRLRDRDTIVYAKKFATPADEYAYEAERLASYRSLAARILKDTAVPEDKRAGLTAADAESSRLSSAAKAQAAAGDLPAAIKSLENANAKLSDAVINLATN